MKGKVWLTLAAALLGGGSLGGLWIFRPGKGEEPPHQPLQGPPHEYFPLNPGNLWIYEVQEPLRGTYRERYEFGGLQEIQGRAFAVIVHTTEKDANYRAEHLFTYGPSGVELYRTTTAMGELATSLRFGSPQEALLTLPLDLRMGKKWEQLLEVHSTLTGRSLSCWVKGEVLGQESVQVPAGTFIAWKVRTQQRIGAEEVEVVGWYAFRVGQVQFERRSGPLTFRHRLVEALVNGRRFPSP